MRLWVWVVVWGWTVGAVYGLELGAGCRAPLGMESRKISDFAVSASSSYDSGSVGPQHARLRNHKQGGAWCPRHMVSRDAREYLEVDLGSLHVVTGVKTQGRYGNGQGQEYAEQYMVEYWRRGLGKWVRWKDRSGKELLSGNTDTFTIVEQNLDPPIITRKLRLLPYSDHVRTVCMRTELMGCNWTDGLVSYAAPQGVRRGSDLDLSDRTYDGAEENGQLSNGLGQLVDGQRGRDNFRLDWNGLGKGYEWVGWRNDTSGWSGLPLEILFEFDRVRNFSAAHLYTNNLFTKDVQVFSHARAFFSFNGHKFSPEPVYFSYMPDLVMEHSRNVTIKLHQRIGKYLKLQLYFASRWILLSEVSFDSIVVSGNFTQEAEEEISAALPDFVGKEYPIQRDEVKVLVSKGAVARNVVKIENSEDDTKTLLNTPQESKSYIGFVIGVLTVVIVLLTSAIVFVVIRNYRLKNALIPDESKTSELEKSNKDDLYKDYAQQLSLGEDYPDVPDLVSKEFVVEEVQKPPPVPPPPHHYYSHDANSTSAALPVSAARRHLTLPLGTPRNDLPDEDRTTSPMATIARDRLKAIEKIGRGTYGDVHLCQLMTGTGGEGTCSTSSGVRNGDVVKGEGEEEEEDGRVCVVYSLERMEYFEEFKRESKSLAKLRDVNFAVLLGASLHNSPFYMVREYTYYGDLCQFLQDHVAQSTTIVSNAKTLSYGSLMFMASQVASGMKYLEGVNFVHKDLATRNCLVGKDYEIKISDVGSYREIYSQDYCRVVGPEPVPLRWMAWESALLGKFSSKSDVWSFAVLLWEILTFAREQPFEWLSDDKVLENLAQYYENSGKQIYLDLPHNCPKEIYDLMLECWNRNETDRPSFKEIHLFLQRKNLGFKPDLR
ncbi:epithelial discoidin domain-containing receptor 1-like [Sitophilus oryzae]|uniref:Epithelial discoidin domain-containing receptor 1-like n=1 Tax=Sitophilus oryzae TaxID=7048 RepID=A0A6J2YQ92_SITOR|nr:epithelial discoidin domain-containing receptor 1-like [Sitophilus oryzae]